MKVARNTVRTALRSDEPPAYQRQKTGSIVDAVEPEIRRLLMATPHMPATVIAERIGWTRSLTVLKDRVRELRPLYLPPDPAGRTEYRAGELDRRPEGRRSGRDAAKGTLTLVASRLYCHAVHYRRVNVR